MRREPIALLYVVILLPMWFRRPNPVIFVPVDFIAVGLYLLYINFATGGHWFLSFAFPVTGAIGLLISAAVALTHYLRGGYLYIYGGMLILGGGLAVLIEFLINLTFQIHETLFWSFYPMVAGIVLGLMWSSSPSASPARIPAPEILPVRQQENKNRFLHSEKHAWTRLGSWPCLHNIMKRLFVQIDAGLVWAGKEAVFLAGTVVIRQEKLHVAK